MMVLIGTIGSDGDLDAILFLRSQQSDPGLIFLTVNRSDFFESLSNRYLFLCEKSSLTTPCVNNILIKISLDLSLFEK